MTSFFEGFFGGLKSKHSAKSTEADKHVVKKNHKKSSGHPVIVGLLHADWCRHCQTMKPEWDKMVTGMNHHVKSGIITVIEIEDKDPQKGAKLKQINSRLPKGHHPFEPTGYPTIFKQHTDGTLIKYQGPRDKTSMRKWFLGNDIVGGFQYKKSRSRSRSAIGNRSRLIHHRSATLKKHPSLLRSTNRNEKKRSTRKSRV
jgi:thiol-disulfide isomerase/thioredoxin